MRCGRGICPVMETRLKAITVVRVSRLNETLQLNASNLKKTHVPCFFYF